MPPGIPGHSAGISFPHEPQRATELLAAAGYLGGKGFLEVDLVTNLALQGVCEHLGTQWQEHLGVEIRWRVVELSESYRILAEEAPPLFIGGWAADYPDPDNFLRVALQSATAWWPEGYSQLVERARRSNDQRERIDLYAQAEWLLVEDAPLLPLVYSRTHLLLKPWVKRYPISALGEFFWKDVLIEPH